MNRMTGNCLCRAVTFTAESVETHYHACHCGMCRRWGGGPLFSTGAQSVTFEGEENIARFDSSKWAQRGFCRRCGTHLFYYLKTADQYSLCIGSFTDDSTAFTLAGEIYVDHKPQGYAFAGEHPMMTEADVLAKYQFQE